jgi:hypothetical protein
VPAPATALIGYQAAKGIGVGVRRDAASPPCRVRRASHPHGGSACGRQRRVEAAIAARSPVTSRRRELCDPRASYLAEERPSVVTALRGLTAGTGEVPERDWSGRWDA